MSTLDYVVLIGYFVLMASIGIYCMRRVKAQEDYFLGSRSFGKLLQTFAAFGAGTGSADPVNTGRTTFTSGMSGMWSVMYWLFVTPFYWITAIWYRRMRHTTLGDWFTERYESRLLGAAYALFGLFFMVTYGSMMFSAIGKVAAPLVGAASAMQAEAGQLGIEYKLVPIIGVIVFVYGTAGGLTAAYWTDLIQGLCIVLLSVLLIPAGLSALVEKFGDPSSMGLLEGFRIMHEQIPKEFFSLFGTSGTSEFPLHFLVAVVAINLMTIVIQPHFIITGGGSAKNEQDARVGLVVGNFLKRFCTIGWVLTALIALALFADSPELLQDPDKTWGVASRELLGPGFTGLMLACLLAALMSSLDVYMIVGSALVVRNVYVPFINPQADEQRCLLVARATGAFIIGGSVVLSLAMMDVFQQLKLTWITLVPVAAPFWVGMYWRRATTGGAWITVAFCALAFFVAPRVAPTLMPDLRTNPAFTASTPVVTTTTTRKAAPTDVARREAAIRVWEEASEHAEGPAGERPLPLSVGDEIVETSTTGGASVYWSGRVQPIGEDGQPMEGDPRQIISEETLAEGAVTRVTRQYAADQRLEGLGGFKCDLLVYRLIGVPIETYSPSTLATLDYPPKILLPFLVMVLASLITRSNSKDSLDRYFAKMKTPVSGDHEADARELDESYRNPDRFEDRKLFPGTNLEFQRPSRADVVGFVTCVGACFAIIYLALMVTRIGA